METELTLPQAEKYFIEYPEKRLRNKELGQYVYKKLKEEHPGFGEDSLWDYRIEGKGEEKVIRAVVLERTYFIEKRINDRKIKFFIYGRDGKKLNLFERRRFDEKGERRKRGKKLIILFLTVITAAALFILNMPGKSEDSISEEVEGTIEKAADALNIFYLLNSIAEAVKEQGGTISFFQLDAADKCHITFSAGNCEPYFLVCALKEIEGVEECRCGNVTYSGYGGKFELKIETNRITVMQKNVNQTELMAMQNVITGYLKEEGVRLISTQTDERSGRFSFLFECTGKELKVINESLEGISLEKNLFIVSLSETKEEDKDLFLINTDFICLDENQQIMTEKKEEKLSDIFEREKERKIMKSDEEKKGLYHQNAKQKGLTKIGSVKKEGVMFYYYRTQEGKIEISERDYE